jgi:hypothetical protein
MSKCVQMANLRAQLARASGVKDQKRSHDSGVSIDLVGIKAELAVSKVLGVEYDVHNLGIDSGADMWFDNISIDVKATMRDGDRLLFKSETAFKARIAILVHATEDADVMRVRGGASRKTFFDRARQQDLGYGPSFYLDNINLTPIEEIWLFLVQQRLK